MSHEAPEKTLHQALGRVEEALLPTLSLMLDSLLDAASLARPGTDADVYAIRLRARAVELASIAREVEALSPLRRAACVPYPAASAA